MMKKHAFVLLLLALPLLFGCGPKPAPETTLPETEPVPTTVPPTTEATEPPVSDGIPVETPLGTLWLPDSWDTPITTETWLGDPMVISFLTEDVTLYDLTFSSAHGADAVGTVTAGAETTFVGVRIHPLASGSDRLLDMQETVNLLLSQLPLEPIPEEIPADPAGSAGTEEDILILTPWGDLHFPLVWEDCLITEQPLADTLEFRCALPDHDPVLLFALHFGSDAGPLTGALTNARGTVTTVSVEVAEPEFDESWRPDERDVVYAMQEDLNYLLLALS